ncbi:MAG: hypothetical protein NC213_03345 [Acetobacter sp.]|nr:hypothetical protein [Bacteroides sp.]MCM1340758.1 hypothetical protein [Acetobacter sp.]MCM1432685.1 hypothetical protein [Clostridiales bacterium]
MRKSIFDIIKNNRNLYDDYDRLKLLFEDQHAIGIPWAVFPETDSDYNFCSIENYIDKKLFKTWVQRTNCIGTYDMKAELDLNCTLSEEEFTEEHFLNFCEYASNMLFLLDKNENSEDYYTDTVYAAKENLASSLDWINYEAKYLPKYDCAIIVPKNETATSVSEIIEENLACEVIRYNHHALKGDVEAKKSILLALATDLEPKRQQLAKVDKILTDNIFFILNNLNIRHNNKNKESKHYKEYVAKMKKTTLEKWYDELYQMILLAYLELDNISRIKKIETLKEKL